MSFVVNLTCVSDTLTGPLNSIITGVLVQAFAYPCDCLPVIVKRQESQTSQGLSVPLFSFVSVSNGSFLFLNILTVVFFTTFSARLFHLSTILKLPTNTVCLHDTAMKLWIILNSCCEKAT